MPHISGDLSTKRPYCMEVTWELRDFFRKPANVNSILKSWPFSLAKAVWQLHLYPNGSSVESSEGFIVIFLKRLNFSCPQQRVKAAISLKTEEGKDYKTFVFRHIFQENDSIGIRYYIRRSQLEKKKHSLLQESTLTVCCLITVEPSSDDSGAPGEESLETDSSGERIGTGDLPSQHLESSSQTEMPDACQHLDASSQTEMSDTCQHLHVSSLTETPDACKGDLQKTSPSVQKLLTDYKTLLESKEDADVCLKVSDQEFRAHKCILRARSSVFSAMFKHDTKEKNSGEVVIKDLDPESFPEFLQHVYAGSVDSLSEENVFNLFIAADKYCMGDLKAECKKYMQRTLSVDTFCDVMILALRYKENELLKVAIDFFCKNLTEIIVTVKWQMFSKEHNTEANELFIKALVPANEN